MGFFTKGKNQLFFSDQGHGETLVIVHGTPTNSSEYQGLIEKVSNHLRCVAIDHLGFGKSDKPESADYSIESHHERLLALLSHLNIRTFHLLVHDFGGAIGLPLLGDTRFDIKSVTILNSWLWPLIETEPQMKHQQWLISLGILPFLYKYLNFSARVLIKMGWGKKNPLNVQRHRLYQQQFPRPSQRNGTIAFMRALFDFNNPCWHRPDLIAKLNERPTQMIWGQADQLVSIRNLERWRNLVPNAKVFELKDIGHFVAEEAPEDVATRLLDFIRETRNETQGLTEQS